jgi:hypothetical protein
LATPLPTIASAATSAPVTASPEAPIITALPITATPAEVFPFTLGAQWVYHITTVTGMPGRLITATGMLTQTVVDVHEQKGMLVSRIWSVQDSTLSDFPHNEPLQYSVLFKGSLYWWDADDPAPLMADLEHGRAASPLLVWPLTVGQMYGSISASPRTDRLYAWDVVAREAVNTPAGRFSDCFSLILRTNSDDTQTWFCPGSGFVRRAYQHHGSIEDVTQVLLSYRKVGVTDDHAADAAIRAARLRLSQNGHTDPMLSVVLHITPTTWLDDCLGLPATGLCRHRQTPGYIIELEKDTQRYRFRTDEAGQQVRLEWTSALPIRDPVVQWRYTDASGCHTALIDSAQTQYGTCGEALLSASSSATSLTNYGLAWPNLALLFKPFIAHTVHGMLIYRGSGTVVASSAQRRAIAEWAAMRYAEADAGYLPIDHGLSLVWRGRSAATCGKLWIYQDGMAAAWDCAGERVIDTQLLSAADLTVFYGWLDSGKRWNIAHVPPVGDGHPDATLSLPQSDASGRVTHEDTEGLLNFARAVYACLSSACPMRIEGRLVAQDGRAFTFHLLAPADWAGKVSVRVKRNIAYVDYQATQKEPVFLITALTEAQWHENQQWPGQGNVLVVMDGIVFTYNVALANPFTGREADEFTQMAGQVQSVVTSFEVMRAR